jgi:oxygen-independent coproporphyrinogen-3 oxidase
VSAIGSIGPTYSQNHRELPQYYDALDRGELPVMRGIELTADDLLRRAVIHALMCQFELAKDAIEVGYLINFDRYFGPEVGGLRQLAKSGLLVMNDRWITVTPKGRMLIRNICMVFDKYLRRARDGRRYSKVI